MDELERAVAQHYGTAGLSSTLLQALTAAGVDVDRLTPADLAPIDEFHIGGRAATEHAVEKLALRAGQQTLDVGCGIGGASRYIADRYGAHVTGIDLTPEFISAAQLFAERTGLSDRLDYRVASALDMPFAGATFDVAITFHVAMNINDRPRLYSEIARVLKPGAQLCIYDVMRGAKDGLNYPLPWAQTPATSRLTTPEEMHSLLSDAGFAVVQTEDRTPACLAFFRDRPAAENPTPLGPQLIMGPEARQKTRNVLEGLQSGAIAAVLMIARRADETRRVSPIRSAAS